MAQPQPLPPEFAEAFAHARPRFGRFASQVLFFHEVDSTNNVATTLASNGACEGAVVVADAQTAGRGRRGRSWFSPPGAGLYVSLVLEPATATDRERATALLTLAAGVALAEGIERATGFAPAIKWPNDLVAAGRKIAGILAEGIVRPSSTDPGNSYVAAVVLGYGINVSTSAFPAELSDRASSLEGELGRAVDRAQLCAESIAAMAARYSDLLAGRFDAILDAWHARAPGSRGARVQWETPGGVRSGTTDGVDRMGALLVRTGGATERLVAGEVTWA
ncbi:MAG TPA: biotin--[acetyl-CoA-carboxylase] ligase [Vicinamibacterales bacterium]|jgi:BirA family biotin operon repressor/biotin-[acetyl-CoA-carboxylase] ligase|nr:biotin--[acetyl-CoA-carboxylase] ligase [Vicinamibacterales bacterium]